MSKENVNLNNKMLFPSFIILQFNGNTLHQTVPSNNDLTPLTPPPPPLPFYNNMFCLMTLTGLHIENNEMKHLVVYFTDFEQIFAYTKGY